MLFKIYYIVYYRKECSCCYVYMENVNTNILNILRIKQSLTTSSDLKMVLIHLKSKCYLISQ